MHLVCYSCYGFTKWRQIREIFGYGDCFFHNFTIILNYPNNGTEDKVWLDNSCEKYRVKATTALRRINRTVVDMKEDRFETCDFEYPCSKCKMFN